ncbi:hypothetical protein LPJ56_004473 [Coemansia sp. RSA 2599]|nr:hypothetical protein LPJ75_004324 [Coemansia sp. RSA 2598]KAJ1815745.1 hypothetical protein LPJ56_004473 [Coemansia sp. RSA 2599]
MLAISQQRLADNYAVAVDFLASHGIRYIPCTAGHFVWFQMPAKVCANTLVKLGKITQSEAATTAWTPENEIEVWESIVHKERVYIPAGQAFFSPEPGWFRLTFAIDKDQLVLAFKRLSAVI